MLRQVRWTHCWAETGPSLPAGSHASRARFARHRPGGRCYGDRVVMRAVAPASRPGGTRDGIDRGEHDAARYRRGPRRRSRLTALRVLVMLLRFVSVAVLGLLVGACRSEPRYVGVGDVLTVDAAARRVTIRHDQIAGLMEAGTTRFAVPADDVRAAL